MKVIESLPPQWNEIKTLNPPENTLFCFGDTLYNPSKIEIPKDVIVHEEVHSKQQERFGSVELWWSKYVLDKNFRFNQELEAYAVEYKWVKERFPVKAQKEALAEFARNLSQSSQEPQPVLESKIRNYAL